MARLRSFLSSIRRESFARRRRRSGSEEGSSLANALFGTNARGTPALLNCVATS
jgi:hypothetical protein